MSLSLWFIIVVIVLSNRLLLLKATNVMIAIIVIDLYLFQNPTRLFLYIDKIPHQPLDSFKKLPQYNFHQRPTSLLNTLIIIHLPNDNIIIINFF